MAELRSALVQVLDALREAEEGDHARDDRRLAELAARAAGALEILDGDLGRRAARLVAPRQTRPGAPSISTNAGYFAVRPSPEDVRRSRRCTHG